MTNNQNKNNKKGQIFDLEERTLNYTKRVIRLCKELSRNPINDRLISQAVGASGSVGANYREANDCLGDKDFLHRMRIARKEAKESIYWLELIEEANPSFKPRMQDLKQEGRELKDILSSIINKRINKK